MKRSEERVGLGSEVGHEEIAVSVVVEICRDHAHARFGLTTAIEGNSQKQSFILKGAVTLVDPELVPVCVVGDVHVLPAVGVQIFADDSEARCRHRSDSRLLANVGERPITIVMEKHIADRLIRDRSTILGFPCTTETSQLRAVIDILGHIQV